MNILILSFAFLFSQIPVPEFRPGQKLPDSPNDSVRAAALFLKSAVEAEQKAKNPNPLLHAGNLRFISLYNLSTHGSRRKLNSKTGEIEEYSPLDDMVKVLLYAVNLTNRINPPATLIKVKNDLFAIYYDNPGWTAESWDSLASKDVYFKREWVQDDSWNYLTYYTYSQYPIMRADQFVSLSTVGPDYYNLLGLPQTITELYKILGIDEKLLADAYRIKGSVKTDNLTVTINNRILERRQGAFDIWSSNDVINSKGKKNALRQLDVIGGDIHRLDIDGQEHFFELGWGGWGTYLNNAAGKRVDEVPINIATDDNYRDHRVLVGRSCFTCHDLAIKPFASDQATLLDKNIVQLRTINPQDAIALAGRYDEKSVQRFIRADQEAYRSAIEDMTGTSPEKISFAYSNVWKKYNEERVTFHQAALESGLSDDGLIAVIQPSIDPNLLKFLELDENKNPRTLARDVWEDVFNQVMLLRGKPVSKEGQVPLPTVSGEARKKDVAEVADFAIIGAISLTAAKAVGEVQEAKVTIKTKEPTSIKGYTKTNLVWMSADSSISKEHELTFRFTADQNGFPVVANVELSTGKFVDIPISVKP